MTSTKSKQLKNGPDPKEADLQIELKIAIYLI